MEETVKRHYAINKKIKEYTEELKFLKARIEDHMEREQLTEFKVDDYTVEKRLMKMERMSKVRCPKDVWNKWCTQSEVESIRIRKKGEKRSRSRSRE